MEYGELSTMERLRNTTPGRFLTAGLIVLTPFVAVEAGALALKTAPASAEDTPQEPSDPYTAASLQQACSQDALTKPTVDYAEMVLPGKPKQTVNVSIDYSAMREECHGIYKRIGQYQIRLQSSTQHDRWFNIYPWSQGGYYTADEAGNGFKQAAKTSFVQDWAKYKCTDGPGKTRVELDMRNQIQRIQDKKVVAQKVFKKSVKVQGAC